MSRVQTSAPANLVPRQKQPGAEAKLVIQNTSDEILRGSDIQLSISAPELVEVSVERCQFEKGSWYPRYDIDPGENLQIPIFIRPQVYRQETGGEISIKIEVDGDSAEEKIALVN